MRSDPAAEVSSWQSKPLRRLEGSNGWMPRVGDGTPRAASGRKSSFGWPLARRGGVKLRGILAKGPKRARRNA